MAQLLTGYSCKHMQKYVKPGCSVRVQYYCDIDRTIIVPMDCRCYFHRQAWGKFGLAIEWKQEDVTIL